MKKKEDDRECYGKTSKGIGVVLSFTFIGKRDETEKRGGDLNTRRVFSLMLSCRTDE